MKKFIISMAFTALPACLLTAQTSDVSNPVVPRPVATRTLGAEIFTLTAKASIGCDSRVEAQARYLQETLLPSTGFDLKVNVGRKGTIQLSIDTLAVAKEEGYRLKITRKGVEIVGHDAAGVFTAYRRFCSTSQPVSISSRCRRTWHGQHRQWRWKTPPTALGVA